MTSDAIPLPIDAGFYESESLPISAQRLVNWHVNIPQANTVTPANIFSTSGLNQLVTVSATSPARGAHALGDNAYFVIGTSLYRLDRTVGPPETWAYTTIGSIPGTGRVSMDDNGTQLCIVIPGVSTYIFTENPDALALVVDPDFDGPASFVVFVDGYFVFMKSTGKKYFHSNLNDGTAYDALDFGTAEADPDQIRSAVVYRNQLFIFGSQTIEVFRNIGRTPNAFQRITGFSLTKGITAPFSATSAQSGFVFLGAGENEAPAIWRFNGNDFDKLSTTAIENALQELTDTELSNMFAWTYAEKGAYFLGFAASDKCFVYDEVNQRWHERESSGGRYRVATMTAAYGRILVGDQDDGRIGEIDRDLATEYGLNINHTWIGQPFDNFGEPISLRRLEAVMETGLGTLTNDPLVRLSWSDDGGKTFSDELARGMGKEGQYSRRVQWRRLGRTPRSRTLKLETSEAIRPTLIKLEAIVA